MRLAEHEKYGRVVVSPDTGRRLRTVFALDSDVDSGVITGMEYPEFLTFIDAEPAKPAHPVFLETVDDYSNAPQRTIVAIGDAAPWVKLGAVWESAIWNGRSSRLMGGAPRRVLRWGDAK